MVVPVFGRIYGRQDVRQGNTPTRWGAHRFLTAAVAPKALRRAELEIDDQDRVLNFAAVRGDRTLHARPGTAFAQVTETGMVAKIEVSADRGTSTLQVETTVAVTNSGAMRIARAPAQARR